MTVKFTVVPRKNPRDLEAAPKYYAAAKIDGRTETNEVSKEIARMSTHSTADTKGML